MISLVQVACFTLGRYTYFPQALSFFVNACICSTHPTKKSQPTAIVMHTSSSQACHTWNNVPPHLLCTIMCLCVCVCFTDWRSDWAQLFTFFLCDSLPLTLFIYVTEEKRTAQSVQQRLWELLAPAGLNEDSGSSPWLHAYRRLLQEEGVDKETQKKAVLMQLWATQVSQSQTSEERRHSVCKGGGVQLVITSRD